MIISVECKQGSGMALLSTYILWKLRVLSEKPIVVDNSIKAESWKISQ